MAGGPGSQLCINIPINDDICCEQLESFQVVASSTNPGVTFSGGSSSSVIIQDNDSECLDLYICQPTFMQISQFIKAMDNLLYNS